MNLLLDTNAFLWIVGPADQLSDTARSAVQDRANTLYLSIASVWEMQIKWQLGKLRLPDSLAAIVAEQQRINGIQILPIELGHVYALHALPQHHKDPFDRLIIAQAGAETFTIVTADPAFSAYGVPLIW
jgi:PIN domain nuclease of toxin-antitoxin system